VCENGKSGSWAGIQGFGLVLELGKRGEGRVCLFRVARKGGSWEGDKCEGDEIVLGGGLDSVWGG